MSLIDKHYTFDYPENIQSVYYKILSVTNQMRGLKLVGNNDNSYTIFMEGSVSFWSWGENVTISCQYLDDYHTRIHIESKPKFSTTLVDWGKGKRNIRNVLDAIKMVLP